MASGWRRRPTLAAVPTAKRIVAALIQRGSRLLLVQAQGPDDPFPVWMLPGGQVEADEGVLEALRREVVEETGLRVVGEPQLIFEVDQDDRAAGRAGRYRTYTYACRVGGKPKPADPDGLIRGVGWVEANDALDRLGQLKWYDCEPLRRFLAGDADAGAKYHHRISSNSETLEVLGS
jgi:8-oxo-dGTP diphosphatase